MLVCAALCALFFNDTALKLGRYPYVVDRVAYANAIALRRSQRTVVVRRPDEGAYVAAASNPHVVLAKYDPHETGYCPAYDKDPRAFLRLARHRHVARERPALRRRPDQPRR